MTPTWLAACAVLCLCLCTVTGLRAFAAVERRADAVAAISEQTMGRTRASWDIHRYLAQAAAAEAETFLGIDTGKEERPYRAFAEAMRNATAAMVRAGAAADPRSGGLLCPGAEPPATASAVAATPAAADPGTADPGAAGAGPASAGTARGEPAGAGTAAGGPRAVPPPGAEAEASAALATLVCLTPVYTRYVGEARANNRLGYGVGGGYLRSANSLMNDHLLPASATLARSHAAEQAGEFQRATRKGDAAALAVTALLALAALVATQVCAVLWTRRWLNPGLLAATLLVAAGVIWPQAAMAAERAKLASARSEGYEVQAMLARAHHLALRAEGDFLYWRIAQGGEILFDADYDRAAAALACAAGGREPGTEDVMIAAGGTGAAPGDGQPGPHEAAARELDLELWCGPATARPLDPGIVTLVNTARLAGAGAIDAPADPSALPAATGSFETLRKALTASDGAAHARFDTEVTGAGDALSGVAFGAGALCALAAALAVAGVAPRLLEYR